MALPEVMRTPSATSTAEMTTFPAAMTTSDILSLTAKTSTFLPPVVSTLPAAFTTFTTLPVLSTTALLPTMMTTATLPVTATTGVLPATVTKSTHSILPEVFSLGLESNNFNTFPFVPPTTGPTHDPFSTLMLELDITSPQAKESLMNSVV